MIAGGCPENQSRLCGRVLPDKSGVPIAEQASLKWIPRVRGNAGFRRRHRRKGTPASAGSRYRFYGTLADPGVGVVVKAQSLGFGEQPDFSLALLLAIV
jgi:hypothetical protein